MYLHFYWALFNISIFWSVSRLFTLTLLRMYGAFRHRCSQWTLVVGKRKPGSTCHLSSSPRMLYVNLYSIFAVTCSVVSVSIGLLPVNDACKPSPSVDLRPFSSVSSKSFTCCYGWSRRQRQGPWRRRQRRRTLVKILTKDLPSRAICLITSVQLCLVLLLNFSCSASCLLSFTLVFFFSSRYKGKCLKS